MNNSPVPQPPVNVEDEFLFWGRQSIEHAQFLMQGFEDEWYRLKASDLATSLQAYYNVQNLDAFKHVLNDGIKFKSDALRAMNEVWLGFNWQSFIQHMIEEELFFLSKIGGKMSYDEEVRFWINERSEEAALSAHLIDPSEPKAVTDATETASAFRGFLSQCVKGCPPAVTGAALAKTQEMNMSVAKIHPGAPRSIISKPLQEHVLREGQRFLSTVGKMPV